MPEFWWRALLPAGALAVLCLLLWSVFDRGIALLGLAGGLAGWLFYHLWNLHRLAGWLSRTEGPAPRAVGPWGETLYRLEQRFGQDRERQRKAVGDLEQMLQATRSLPDGLVILDRDARILWLNDTAERQLGLARARDLGQYVYYLLRNARFTEWLALEEASQPLQMKAPGGTERTLSLQLVALPRQQRMLFVQDITEQERVDAMRRDFVANVSHELRTPVTVIAGFLEAFEDMPAAAPEAFREHVHLMREQSDRIRRLLDDLLTLARLESEQDKQNEVVDVPALLEALLAEARSLSHGRHDIRLELASRVKVLGHGQDLHSAFGNLVSNAVRYTPAGGRVTLRWGVGESGSAELAVADTGEGIEAQHIPRLTERFYRVDRGRSRASGGTGLGLAIVKHVLQRHQGRLRIESTLGKGSTFTAVVPADRVIPATAPAASATPPPDPA